jgi:hypothetical protein
MLIRIAISGTKRIVNKYAIIVILIYTFNWKHNLYSHQNLLIINLGLKSDTLFLS